MYDMFVMLMYYIAVMVLYLDLRIVFRLLYTLSTCTLSYISQVASKFRICVAKFIYSESTGQN